MSPSTPWWRLKLKLCSLHLKLNKWWQSNLGYTLVVSFGGVSISFEWVESCIKWKSQFRAKLDLEIFCQKTRQNEGRSAVRSWNVNKLSQIFTILLNFCQKLVANTLYLGFCNLRFIFLTFLLTICRRKERKGRESATPIERKGHVIVIKDILNVFYPFWVTFKKVSSMNMSNYCTSIFKDIKEFEFLYATSI